MNKLQNRLAEAADHANVLNGALELALQATNDPELIAKLREIKDRGYRLALDLGDVFWRIVEGNVDAPQDAPPRRARVKGKARKKAQCKPGKARSSWTSHDRAVAAATDVLLQDPDIMDARIDVGEPLDRADWSEVAVRLREADRDDLWEQVREAVLAVAPNADV